MFAGVKKLLYFWHSFQIHYDDAASCVMQALLIPEKSGFSERLFLVSDGSPISRKEICAAALKNPEYAGLPCPEFVGDCELIDGKRYDVSRVRNVLKWNSAFGSFSSFMEEGYKQEKECILL